MFQISASQAPYLIIFTGLLVLFWATSFRKWKSKSWLLVYISACVADLISTYVFVYIYGHTWSGETNTILNSLSTFIGHDTAITIHLLVLVSLAYFACDLSNNVRKDGKIIAVDHLVGFVFYSLAIFRIYYAGCNIAPSWFNYF